MPTCRPEEATLETEGTNFNIEAWVSTYALECMCWSIAEKNSIGRPVDVCVDL